MQLKLDASDARNAALQRLIEANDQYQGYLVPEVALKELKVTDPDTESRDAKLNALQIQLSLLSAKHIATLKSRAAANIRAQNSLEAERERNDYQVARDLDLWKSSEETWKKREAGWEQREEVWEKREADWGSQTKADKERYEDLQQEHYRAQAFFEETTAALNETLQAQNEEIRKMGEKARTSREYNGVSIE